MLGSAFDGEIANAGRMAQKLIKDEHTTWEEALNGTNDKTVEMGKAAYKAGYDDGYKVGMAAATFTRPKALSWTSLAKELDEMFHDQLTPWEQGFIESYRKRGWASPTEKQRKIFERIAERLDLDLPT